MQFLPSDEICCLLPQVGLTTTTGAGSALMHDLLIASGYEPDGHLAQRPDGWIISFGEQGSA